MVGTTAASCQRSSAMATAVKYERDIQQPTFTLVNSKNWENNETDFPAQLNPRN